MTPQRKKYRLGRKHTHTHIRMITLRELTGDLGALVVNNSSISLSLSLSLSLPLLFSFLSISVLSNPYLFIGPTVFSLIQPNWATEHNPIPAMHTLMHIYTHTLALMDTFWHTERVNAN